MRLTQKRIETILLDIVGEEGLPLVRELLGKENISEFVLADKLKEDIKVVRRVLYNLYNHNLVGFTRKKDKTKGWYIYYWTLLPESIKFTYYKKKKAQLDKLKKQLEEEKDEFYFVCSQDCARLTFDQAMEFEFHCPECGELVQQDEREKRTLKMKERIKILEKDLEDYRNSVKKVVKKSKPEKRVLKKKTAKKKVKKKVVKRKVTKKKLVKAKKLSKKKSSANKIKKKTLSKSKNKKSKPKAKKVKKKTAKKKLAKKSSKNKK